MMRFLEEAVSRRALVAGSALLIGLGAMQTQASTNLLENGSFENDDVTPDPGDPFNPANGVSPEIDIWEESGPLGSFGEFTGLTLDTGVFFNVPIPLDPPLDFGDPFGSFSEVPAVGNADGTNLAYLQINKDADGVGEDRVAIWQEVLTPFAAGSQYEFSIFIGQSVTGTPENAAISLEIGYFAPVGGGFESLADLTVEIGDLKFPYNPLLLSDPAFPLLDEFSLVADTGLDPLAVGNEIVVRATVLSETDGSGGFILDSARLTVVPEPTSLALLAVTGLIALRRRR